MNILNKSNMRKYKHLTLDQILNIYKLHIKKEKTQDIAIKYNVSSATINRIIQKENKKRNINKRYRTTNSPKHDIVGLFFGKLEVIEKIKPEKRNPWLFRCKCHSCGSDNFIREARYIKNRINPTCGCKEWERKKGKENSNYTGYGEMSGCFWGIIRKNAIQRKIPLKITKKYAWQLFLKQKRKCAISGLDIYFGKSNYVPKTASLDRIDNKKGYINGNVQWVHKNINFMKGTLTMNELLDICKLILKKHGIKTIK